MRSAFLSTTAMRTHCFLLSKYPLYYPNFFIPFCSILKGQSCKSQLDEVFLRSGRLLMLSKEGLVKKRKKRPCESFKISRGKQCCFKTETSNFFKVNIQNFIFPYTFFFIFLLRESRNKFLLLFYIVAKSPTFLMQSVKIQFKNQ